MRAALVLLLATSCTVSVPLAGKRCAASEPRCLPGYVCVDDVCVDAGATIDGGADAGAEPCPLDVDPAANACSGTTWYLSPSGSDLADGRSPATARRTLPAGVMRGDVVHLLGGTYAQVPAFTLAMSGSAACPLVVEGERDGGTVLGATLTLEGAYLVFRDLVFSPLNDSAVEISSNANHVTFQRDTFRSRAPTAGFPTDLLLYSFCSDCVVRECSFESPDGVSPLSSTGPRFVFRGNRVQMGLGAGIDLGGASPIVEGNEFTGNFNDDTWLDFAGATNARLSRNVFHDIVAGYPDKVMISGPVRVSHNTFARISGNTRVPLVEAARFDDNLVTVAGWVVGTRAPDAGDFNVFDPSVTRPYSDFDGGTSLPGTDRIALVELDTGFIPAANSAAVDSADPSLAVPPGGGARGDIGALERGASRIADGRYCLLDGGF